MSLSRVYLDYNATSPLRPEARAAFVDALGAGNASSVHAEGRRSRALVEAARIQVASLVGARPEDVVFTSGGTEANVTALRPGALVTASGRPVRRLLVGATEHPSCLAGHGFAAGSVETIPVDGSGRVQLDALARSLGDEVPTIVSVHLANSETGVLQPIEAVSRLVRAADGVLHADGVQAAGRLPLDMAALGLDALSLTGHKLGGPVGAGALVVAPGRAGPSLPLLSGGGQERGRRAGTENVVAIAGFGAAAEAAGRDLAAGESVRLRAIRDALEAGLRELAPDLVVFGGEVDRLPNTLSVALPGLRAETALAALDLAGIAVSAGSACASGKVGRSPVLAAMGVPEAAARGALRLSAGWNSSHEDVSRVLAGFGNVLQRLYERERARAA